MKRNKMLSVLSLAVVISLLAIIIPVVPAMAATISVTPAAGPPGTSVSISGGGYTANNSVTIAFDVFNAGTGTSTSTNVATANTDSSGSFVTHFTIPNQPAGTYNFAIGSNTAPFTITPTLAFSTSTGRVGDQVSISGTAFRNAFNVRVYFDNNVVVMPVSTANGSFTATFKVPEAAQGKHTMYASDNAFNSPNYDFTITPKLTVTPTSTTAGSIITVSGSGYTAFSTITFNLDGANIGSVTSANNVGSFTDVQLTVPVVSAGSHALKATDNGGFSDSTSLITAQALTNSPASGAAGTEIKLSGGGFAANKTITVTYDSKSITTDPSVITSDANGNFSSTNPVTGNRRFYLLQVP